MSKIKLFLMGIVVMLGVAACSPVTVPPAHVGKMLTPSGYQPEVLPSGKYWELWREDLVLLDISTNTYSERVEVKLRDKLTLYVDVRFRGRVRADKDIINSMFNDIDSRGKDRITFSDIYGIYGSMVVQNKTREIVSQYNVDEVHQNYARISAEVAERIASSLANTPIAISDVMFANIDYPKVVNAAIEAAEERRLAIAKEEAQAEIEMTKKRNEQRLAEANYQVEMTKAKAVRDANKILAEGVTPELLELKRLEYMTTLAEKAGEGTVYVPVEFAGNVGVDVKMFGGK